MQSRAARRPPTRTASSSLAPQEKGSTQIEFEFDATVSFVPGYLPVASDRRGDSRRGHSAYSDEPVGDEAERVALRRWLISCRQVAADHRRRRRSAADAQQRIPAPTDEAKRLEEIEHIVVVMLENRSFDHMLGYLSLPAALGGRDRADVDGLQRPGRQLQRARRDRAIRSTTSTQTQFEGEAEDPDHSGGLGRRAARERRPGLRRQLRADLGGARAKQLNVPVPDPGLVMGYYDSDDLPVYDHLAAEYCVVDRWFSSVPGSDVAEPAVRARGAGGRESRRHLAAAVRAAHVRALPRRGERRLALVLVRPGTLRAVDPAYRLSNHDRFGFVDARKLSIREEVVGKLTEKGSFLDDVATGKLPQVSLDRSALQGPARARTGLQRRPPAVATCSRART